MCAKRNGKESQSQSTASKTNGDDLRRALDWIVVEDIFKDLRIHGNASWIGCVCSLLRLAIFWVWDEAPGVKDAATNAITAVERIYGPVTLHSYQALMRALKQYTGQLLPLLWMRLQECMQSCDQKSMRIGLWLALAVDGSRISVPRTRKNEERFCKRGGKKQSKKKKTRGRHASDKYRQKTPKKKHYNPQPVAPQMWLTLLWHIGQRLPWCWSVGPSYSSERHHHVNLLTTFRFPENSLFCGDAGFTGYEYWRAIIDAGHSFLVRVGGNVQLLSKLGYVRERNGIVCCWPNEMQKKKLPPLVLRLIRFQTARGHVYLVTNILSKKQLSDVQAAKMYRLRWGVEIEFRNYKQTYKRNKLRCANPDCAEVELHWSLLGLWIMKLLAFKEQVNARVNPQNGSVATILRIVRTIIKDECRIAPRGASLQQLLAGALTDDYQRQSKKKSRNYPRRKEEPCAGPPIITTATAEHRRQIRTIRALAAAA